LLPNNNDKKIIIPAKAKVTQKPEVIEKQEKVQLNDKKMEEAIIIERNVNENRVFPLFFKTNKRNDVVFKSIIRLMRK
jgi:hypothetical protein